MFYSLIKQLRERTLSTVHANVDVVAEKNMGENPLERRGVHQVEDDLEDVLHCHRELPVSYGEGE